MTSSLEEPHADPRAADSRQNRLIIVLADISGYTDLMVANQTAAVHGPQTLSPLTSPRIMRPHIIRPPHNARPHKMQNRPSA